MLETFKINIATKDYSEERLYRKIIFLFVSVILLLLIFNLISWTTLQGKIRGYQQKIDHLKVVMAEKEKEEKMMTFSDRQIENLKNQMTFASKLIIKDVFPWPVFLDKIEKNVPDGLVLESIVYTGDKNAVAITGRAESTEKVATFLNGLNDEKGLASNLFSILSVEPKPGNTRGDNKKISFEITSKLNVEDFFLSGEI